VIGYVALAPGVVRRDEVAPTIGRGSPDVVPVFVIARLAVDERWQGRGLGRRLLLDVLRVIVQATELAGGRLIIVDAIDERARRFYEHHGFRSSPSGTQRLAMNASRAAASVIDHESS